jgi:hypothetical protein
MKTLYASNFLEVRLGDKPILKKGGMLPPKYLTLLLRRMRKRSVLQEGTNGRLTPRCLGRTGFARPRPV